MGLDMHLSVKKHLADYDFMPEEKKVTKAIYALLGVEDIVEHDNSVIIDIPVAYWRKANAIHKWMVDNVQGGVDDCGEYHVPPQKLEMLLSICKDVMENPDKATQILPPSEGFFFGSVDIDDRYFSSVKYTIERLEKIVGSKSNKGFGDIYYRSSW